MAKKNRIKDDASIGEILRNLRKKAKLTQADMAHRIGVAEWLYGKYEKDIAQIPLKLVNILKDYEDFDDKLISLMLLRAYCEDLGDRLAEMPLEKRMDALAGIMKHIEENAEEIENINSK